MLPPSQSRTLGRHTPQPTHDGPPRHVRRAGWVAGVAALLLVASAAWPAAKPGMVKTKEGGAFFGQVDEDSTPGRVDISAPGGGRTSIDRRNIATVTYFSGAKEEFDARFANLPKSDVAAHLLLARFALDNKLLDEARQTVLAAKQIAATNAEADSLLKTIDQQIAIARPPAPATQPTVTTPVAPPANTGTVGAPAAAVPVKAAVGRAKRQVTPDEINRIRQMEWSPEDKTVRFRMTPDVRKKILELNLATPAEVSRMTPPEMAQLAFKSGPESLQKEVRFVNDPAPLAEYRTKINRFVVVGCASAACHGGEKAGNLTLFPGDSEAAAYSNFVILQETRATVRQTEYVMVDRTRSAESLLIQFALPPETAAIPHPAVAGYKGAIRSATDRNYLAITKWIGTTLSPVAPTYDIDLSRDPEPDKPATPPATPTTPAATPTTPPVRPARAAPPAAGTK